MANNTFTVKFWGVRGSYPTPGPQTMHYGGNTACVEVRAAGHTIILDAGTGIIPLGRELATRSRQSGQPVRALILFSHLHHDHTQGFPFFAPAYNPGANLRIYGPGSSEQALEDLLARNQTPPAFPITLRDMHAAREIRTIGEMDSIALDENGIRLLRGGGATPPDAAVIRLMKSYSHPGGVYFYRIEWRGRSVVYATDTEGYVGTDRRLAAFAQQRGHLSCPAGDQAENLVWRLWFCRWQDTAAPSCARYDRAGHRHFDRIVFEAYGARVPWQTAAALLLASSADRQDKGFSKKHSASEL